jgi:hypothetical protein
MESRALKIMPIEREIDENGYRIDDKCDQNRTLWDRIENRITLRANGTLLEPIWSVWEPPGSTCSSKWSIGCPIGRSKQCCMWDGRCSSSLSSSAQKFSSRLLKKKAGGHREANTIRRAPLAGATLCWRLSHILLCNMPFARQIAIDRPRVSRRPVWKL